MARRQVRNQFNIQSSVIGQLSVGNKGPTTYNQVNKTYESGATDTDYRISGGNFTQANIGGEATYNNTSSKIGGGAGGDVGVKITELAMQESGIVEEVTLRILRTGVSSQQLQEILKKKITLGQIEKGLCSVGREGLDGMVQSMLQHDAMETE